MEWVIVWLTFLGFLSLLVYLLYNMDDGSEK